MDAIKKPRLAQFTKTILDLGFYMTSTLVVLWIGILGYAIIKQLPLIWNGVYLFSGLRVGLNLDTSLYTIAIPEMGVEDLRMMDASFILYAMQGGGSFLALGVVATVIQAVVVLVLLYNLRLFVKTIIDQSPFVQLNRVRLRRIGIGLVVAFCALLVIEFVHVQLIVSSIQAENIEISPGRSTTASTWMLITGLLALVVADAFRHGTDLQIEQDLTV